MSSAVTAFLHVICTRVNIVPRGKSGTNHFAWIDSRDSSIVVYSLDSSTIFVKIKLFCGSVPEKREVKYVSKKHENLIIDIYNVYIRA